MLENTREAEEALEALVGLKARLSRDDDEVFMAVLGPDELRQREQQEAIRRRLVWGWGEFFADIKYWPIAVEPSDTEPLLAWVRSTEERKAGLKALGGEEKLRSALQALWIECGWDLNTITWLSHRSNHSDHPRVQAKQRLAKATRMLHRLDGLDVPREILAPLETFLCRAEAAYKLSTESHTRGRAAGLRTRVRCHLNHEGIQPAAIARLELGWFPGTQFGPLDERWTGLTPDDFRTRHEAIRDCLSKQRARCDIRSAGLRAAHQVLSPR